MAYRRVSRLLGAVVPLALALAVTPGPSAALAQDREPLLRLRAGAFDPLAEAPRALIDRRADAGEAIYIVQFRSTPLPADQAALTALGGRVQAALQDHALIVRMSPLASARVARLARVRWVGPFLADYRLEEALLQRLTGDPPLQQAAGRQRYTILLFENDQGAKDRVALEIRALGGTVNLLGEGRLIEATMGENALRELAGLNEVLFVERWTEPEDDMDLVRALSGANLLETVESYSGEGVRGEVLDNGLRTSHGDFQSNPPLIHGANSTTDDHGTPTYGIVFGDGTGDARGRGLLPDAEQPIFSSYLALSDRYDHTAELVDPGGPYRAVFQSNSWGNARTTNYTSISAAMDDIIFDHDILITQSQSNAGDQMSRPQAWAKNIVSVGGIVHLNTATRSDDFWGFSASIGPAADGRIKPDLAAFYDSIRTTSNAGDSSYRQFGGTSAATPEVAGAFGLLFQMWADGVFAGGPGLLRDVFDSRPHAATAKALMINSAFQYAFSGTGDDLTRVHQGWGFPDLQNLYDSAQANGWSLPILIDETAVIGPGEVHLYQLRSLGDEPLKATMVYMDPPGIPNASVHRVNDLTLKATSPSGLVYWGNNGLLADNWSSAGGAPNVIDTVENIFIEVPEAGVWRIEVLGGEIVQDAHVESAAIDADYALVVIGGSTNVLPEVSVTASDATATEAGPTGGGFTISRSHADPTALTVHYGVSGSATAGSDYAALGGSVVIPAGAGSAPVAVDPVDDGAVEPNETVVLTLAADAAYAIGVPASGTVTITSDDVALPVVSLAASDATATEAGPTSGAFTVSRAGDTTAALTVRYGVSGSATSGSDYAVLGGSVEIPAGAVGAVVRVDPIDDAAVEPDETVVLTLAADAAYAIGAPLTASVTIRSDDVAPPKPTVTITRLEARAWERGRVKARARITRTGDTSEPLTVRYRVRGTATPGKDYRALRGTKVIRAGRRGAIIAVRPIDDTLVEPDETVVITLRSRARYDLARRKRVRFTIKSDDRIQSSALGSE